MSSTSSDAQSAGEQSSKRSSRPAGFAYQCSDWRYKPILPGAVFLSVGAVLLLAGCGGAGGGSGGTAGGAVTDNSNVNMGIGGGVPVAPQKEPFQTNFFERTASYGLGAIDAEAAYQAGATGEGTKVAVIDSGIDVDHPEFAGRIDPASTDIVAGGATTLDDTNGHGTNVSSIVAANADGLGTMGVAPKAQILAIRADSIQTETCPLGGCSYSDDNVAEAINYAIDNGAQIINLSLGKTGPINSNYQNALIRAVQNDVLIVASTGNEGNSDTFTPARKAEEFFTSRHIIAVGSHDINGQPAFDSNWTDNFTLAQRFLLAPGVDIFVASNSGGYSFFSGTSAATPHVAGAAALIKSHFPSMTMAEVAELLLTTADDISTPGIDLFTGRGLLSLDRAFEPQGEFSVAAGSSIDDDLLPVANSRLMTGPSFGDALAREEALTTQLALDGFKRPYHINLENRFERSEPEGWRFEGLLAPVGDQRQDSANLVDGLRLDMVAADRQEVDPLKKDLYQADDEEQTGDVYLKLSQGSLDFSASINSTRAALGSLDVPLKGFQTMFPFYQQAGHASFTEAGGYGLGLSYDLNGAAQLSAGLSMARADSVEGSSQVRSSILGAAVPLTDKLALQLGFEEIVESQSIYGTTGSGLLEVESGNQTVLLHTGLSYEVNPQLHVFGRGSFGRSDDVDLGEAAGSFENAKSNAFSAGMIYQGMFRSGDMVGLMLQQPLRLEDARLKTNQALVVNADRTVTREAKSLSVEPGGRQIDLQLGYQFSTDLPISLRSWLLASTEFGHDSSRAFDWGTGLKLIYFYN